VAAAAAAARVQGRGIRSENTVVQNEPFAVPAAHGGQPQNLAKRRGLDAGGLHFDEGAGVADRRVVFSGPLRAARAALAGLRYVSRYDADPGGAGAGERPCAGGLLCGQVGGSAYSALGGYGAVGYDELRITVDDNGHSDRLCGAGSRAACVFARGAPQRAAALIELTIAPGDAPGAVGARAGALDGPGLGPECLLCYAPHPADPDLCVHESLYPVGPRPRAAS
jgi:hypothetical protein